MKNALCAMFLGFFGVAFGSGMPAGVPPLGGPSLPGASTAVHQKSYTILFHKALHADETDYDALVDMWKIIPHDFFSAFSQEYVTVLQKALCSQNEMVSERAKRVLREMMKEIVRGRYSMVLKQVISQDYFRKEIDGLDLTNEERRILLVLGELQEDWLTLVIEL